MAVPGPITSRQSAYCHEILHEGDARLVADTAHVLKVVSTSQTPHELAGPSTTETAADHRSTN
jgi:predicted Rossmann fold nucleotide-binding protein DprA/Smf involved in DNA uptake